MLSGNELVQDDTEGVDVGGRPDGVALGLLGGHIAGRADDGAADSEAGGGDVVGNEQFAGDAEVHEDGGGAAGARDEHDVAGFDVAMNDAGFVDGGEGAAELHGNAAGVGPGHGAGLADSVGEGDAVAKGLAMTRNGGAYYVVGYGGKIEIPTIDMITSEKTIVGNLVGTYAELVELMALADRGLVKLHTREYKLSAANDALHDLHHGRINGRAVLIP